MTDFFLENGVKLKSTNQLILSGPLLLFSFLSVQSTDMVTSVSTVVSSMVTDANKHNVEDNKPNPPNETGMPLDVSSPFFM